MTKTLLVIDLQNDYFPGGKFPRWNTDVVLQNIEQAIAKANAQDVPIVHIQHVAKQGNESRLAGLSSTRRKLTSPSGAATRRRGLLW